MAVYRDIINLQSEILNPTFHDVTDEVKRIVKQSGIKNGICVVYSHHTTCSVMTQENSHDTNYWGLEFLQQDLCNIMEKLIPTCRTEGQYMHPGQSILNLLRKQLARMVSIASILTLIFVQCFWPFRDYYHCRRRATAWPIRVYILC